MRIAVNIELLQELHSLVFEHPANDGIAWQSKAASGEEAGSVTRCT